VPEFKERKPLLIVVIQEFNKYDSRVLAAREGEPAYLKFLSHIEYPIRQWFL
jgi:hypothetical protein